ncbi:uncharacterized protein [Montipora foliosa]|uniref:uncharacterized protein n=1 Tax=Montipora foliosa TaxID=591990 RepID=UPI0035F1963E
MAASTIQRKELRLSGLVTNEEKSNWEPRQVGEWLGLVIDTIAMQYRVPDKKLAKLKSLLDGAVSDKYITIRQLARIAGSVISISLAVGPIARLCTRQMYYAIESRIGGWDQCLTLSPALLEELRFWLFNIDSFNGFAIRPPCSTSPTVIYTDASDFAFGGYSTSLSEPAVRGMWLREDASKSSTFREVKAVPYVLMSYEEKLKSSRVVIKTDSQCAARVITVGSTKPHLQSLAMDVFQLCFRQGITLEAQWIPRSLNDRADVLSRFIDPDDWSVHPSVFHMLDARFGPHTVDRFSSHYNFQLPLFNTKYASPGSCGVDALILDWSGHNNWLCPPANLIVKCVRHLESCRGTGTLIISEWPSAFFWPFLHADSSSFKPFVKEVVPLPRIKDLLLEGPGQAILYKRRQSVFVGCPAFRILALRLEFI